MKLIADFGNTLQKLAIFEKNEMIDYQSFTIVKSHHLQKLREDYPAIQSAIISSVVSYSQEVTTFLKSHFKFIELNHLTPLPIENKYMTPASLGSDRLAAVTGCASKFSGQDILVINAGTCITYDLITKEKKYLGGAISPGLQMRFAALHNFTGKLPFVESEFENVLIGSTTNESISSGVYNGVLAEVDGIINRYKENYALLTVVLSGGNLNFFDNKLKNNIFAVPNIVLIGLNEILDFNEYTKKI